MIRQPVRGGERRHRIDSAHENVIEQANTCDPDYIVMGSHGHTAFYDLLVGSTTHGVLMRAKCPVVIVPSAKGEAKPRKKEQHAAQV